MSEEYLKRLESKSKNFVKQEKVEDVVIYGSAVKGKENPNDVDVVLIFEGIELKERLRIAQKFKEAVKGIIKNVHVETANLKDLFDKSYFARQGIINEGISLIRGESLAKRLGFIGYSLFAYHLKNLDHNQKTRFIYALTGRGNNKGIIDVTKAQHIGKGALLVPIENSIIFEDFLKAWKINYNKKQALISEI
ncbi:MAG: nucleotidyltransferase domain-containing protein [Nanoarchaeota archaeon]